MSSSIPHRTARDRESRRTRIMALMQGGHSYEAIAQVEKLTRERVRQIVAQSLQANGPAPVSYQRVQMARLEPALRLAASAVAEGQLSAIAPLLRVLDRLDRYDKIDPNPSDDRENIRERLRQKLDRVADRMRQVEEASRSPPESLEPANLRAVWPVTP